MKKYKVMVDGWSDDEAYYCYAESVHDALYKFGFMFFHFVNDYKKFTIEVLDEKT